MVPRPANSAKNLGQRLRAARESAGLSTRVVARRLQASGIRISHTTINNHELGRALPSPEALDALASIYERPKEWMLDQGPVLSGVKYRALKSVRVSEKKKYEGETLPWIQAYLHVERLLSRQRIAARITVDATTTGKDLAVRLRRKYKLSTYPIPSVVRLLENHGVRVVSIDTQSRIDGLAAFYGTVPVVALNTSLPNDRTRLNAAHELGHHLFTDCANATRLTEKEVEKRTFEFASHLLLPDEQLENAFELKSMVRLVQYKERFGISLAALIYRARQSNLIHKRLYERLWQEFGRLGWRKDEPGHVPPDRPLRMEALIDAAIHNGKMTYANLALHVGLDEGVIRQRVLRAMGADIWECEGRAESSILRIDDVHGNYGSFAGDEE